ncbi:unnamed protein product [Kuraishia capsulata CBS 1993]|uniref:2-dehydropantolactone reductase n=1 Tax=Kuraishia capsulata CBS 1993 TaxID=1382522 RepID=W6MWB1_9ASCO|nr:uncharacterized protein KUCA_T00003112001 [Kuraishia capsulata CBS 1993]CDK27135.1 unnamed protein product [Kuraishia capsulata CBS 1993]
MEGSYLGHSYKRAQNIVLVSLRSYLILKCYKNMIPEYLTLNTGAKMPALGFGTWTSVDRNIVGESVEYAILEAGYRLIDTAYFYECEDQIGEALKRVFATGKVKREDLFITTKVWPTFGTRIEEGLDRSLADFGLDYVDLCLIHCPVPIKCDSPDGKPLWPLDANGRMIKDHSVTHVDMYLQLEKAYKSGKAKAIGISNYSEIYIEELLKSASVVPAVNQIEIHPLLPQRKLAEYCQSKGIALTAFSPFGGEGAPILKNEAVKSIAEKYNVTTSTILLSFPLNLGISTIPKSFKKQRILDNLKVIDLEQEDIEKLIAIGSKSPVRYDREEFGVDLGFEDWKPELFP